MNYLAAPLRRDLRYAPTSCGELTLVRLGGSKMA